MLDKIQSVFNIYFVTFLLGIIHWVAFMGYGSPDYNSFDWRITYPSYELIKEAITNLTIPYYATFYGGESLTKSTYDIKFFALPNFGTVSPHLVLLKFISVSNFIVVNTIIYFSIGFWGVLKWIKELKLTTSAAVYLIVMFCFNGYLTSKMGIGWLGTNFGYFLLPNFLWIVYKFINKSNYTTRENLIIASEFSFLMFFTILNASAKCLYQFGLVSLLVLICFPKRLGTYFYSLCITFLLVSFWFWPSFLFSPYVESIRSVYGGYGCSGCNWQQFLIMKGGGYFSYAINTIVSIIQHYWTSLTVSYNAAFDIHHEFNLYVGYIGIIVILFGLCSFYNKNKILLSYNNNRKIYKTSIINIILLLTLVLVSVLLNKVSSKSLSSILLIFIPMVVMIYFYVNIHTGLNQTSNRMMVLIIPMLIVTFLSIYSFNLYLYKLIQYVIYIPAFDRTPGKLFGYVFYSLILLSAIHFDSLFNIIPSKYRQITKWVIIAVVFTNLMVHSTMWSVYNTELMFNSLENFPNYSISSDPRGVYDVTIYDINENNNYKQVVNISYIVSFTVFIIVLFLYFMARFKPNYIGLDKLRQRPTQKI